jgi:NitT/TauT family transport system substrate-binding protein
MKKRWLVTLVLVFSVTILFSSRSMAQEEVKIGYLSIVLCLPTFVALEKGYFQEQGLKVVNTPFESGTILIDALVTGRIDVCAATSTTPHWLAEQNLPGTFKIFLMYGSTGPKDSTFILTVAKDAPFKEIKDLKGKKVATFPGMESVTLAKAILSHYLDPHKDVIMTEVPPGNIVQALAARQIDAYFAPEPLGMIAVAQGVGRYLVQYPLLILNLTAGHPGAAFSFNSKFLKEKPLVAKKVKAAIYKGVDFIGTNEQEARKFLVKYTSLPEPFAMKIPLERWSKVEQFNKSSAQAYFEFMKKEGLFKKDIDTTQLYYQE